MYIKYRSVIVSCVLHALFFLALLYTKLHQNAEQLYPYTKQPAKVHLERSFPQHTQPLQQDSSAVQNENVPVQKIASEEDTEILEETTTLENGQPRTDSPYQLQVPSLDNSLGGSSEIVSTPHRAVSRDAFMQAFSKAFHQEQGRATGSPSQEEFKGPTHVQERLKEWGQYHYKEKLYGALRRASKFAATTMHHERSLERMAMITVTIKKDGTLGSLSAQQLSGIKEVDEHLLKVLHSADFPPIPDRYGTDTFVFTLPIRISLQAGSGVYRLFV